MPGNKETKEMIIGLSAISNLIWDRVRDGMDYEDLQHVFRTLADDKEFLKAVKDAADGREKIKEEMEDLSVLEIADIGLLLFKEMKRIVL